MSTTVTDIQTRIAAIVDQSSSSPSEGGDDWNLRLEYINLAQREWAESYDWPNLYKEYNFLASTASSIATYALPGDFRKLKGYPKITADGSTTNEYTEIKPTEKEQYATSDKETCWILNTVEGDYNLIVNPPSIVSGASIFVPYQSTPSSLASPNDNVICPNPDYLVQRSVALLWEAREDGRFPQAKAEADKILARLLEIENTPGEGSNYRRVRTYEEKRTSHRWGRD